MEDGLRGDRKDEKDAGKSVLILVLVEDGLRELEAGVISEKDLSLNPCSCGRWSQR